jgi:beta-ureidopropionase / N-carbamoyl-L-amino-acid hydrolase
MRNLPCFVLLLFWVASGHAQSASATFHINSQRLQGTLGKLSEFGRNPEGGVTRLGFSETDLAAREYVTGLMKHAGLEVEIDPTGNIFGLRAGSEKLPILLFGSHIDSVLHGGNFDGDVGSMGAIGVMRVLNDANVKTRHPLEAVIWVNEEGNHFRIGTLGSGVAAGSLGPEILERKDDGGLTLADWLRRYRQNPAHFTDARIPTRRFVRLSRIAHRTRPQSLRDQGSNRYRAGNCRYI